MDPSQAMYAVPNGQQVESQYVLYEPQSNGESDQSDTEGRRRSRRSSRDRDRRRSRSRDRKHRRKRRKHRSRSRSRSRDHRGSGSGAATMHIKPTLARFGTSVTGLLEQCNQYEAQIQQMTIDMQQNGQRFESMNAEIRNLQGARSQMQSEITRLNGVLTKKDKDLMEVRKNNTALHNNNANLKKQLSAFEAEKAKEVESRKELEAKATGMESECDFLRKRNEVLLKKCEELVEKQRTANEMKEESLRTMETIKRDTEIAQHEISLKMDEYRRMEGEVASAQHKERLWMRERMELERRFAGRETVYQQERMQWETERKRETQTREMLESRLRAEKPEEDANLGIATLNRTLEAVKAEFEEQLRILQASVEPLRNKLQNQLAMQNEAQCEMRASANLKRAKSVPPQ